MLENKLTIYHGSCEQRLNPICDAGKLTNDYGRGFYCTESLEISKIYSSGIAFSKIIRMYHPFHEAELSKFIEAANNISIHDTALQKL